MLTINKSQAFIRFIKKMKSFDDVPGEELDKLVHAMKEKHFNKGSFLLQEGQVCRHYYFIVRGCIRSFSLKDDREINVNFYFEDDTACDFESFRTEEPSLFNLVAMEDCIVLSGAKKIMKPLFISDESLHILLFRFFQDLFLEEEKHSNSFKLLSPEERYQYLIASHPEYLQRIPLMHIASYLGISRETLNRIRKKLS